MPDSRLFHLIKKEFIHVLREKRLLGIIIIAPILQLIIFGYVATTDVKNISMAVFDQDRTVYSRELVSEFRNSGYFNIKYYANSFRDERELIDSGKIKVALNIPPDFSGKLRSGRKVPVQFVLDGTDANSTSVSLGYINGIVFEYSLKQLQKKFGNIKDLSDKINIIDVRTRVFYNQSLTSVNYMVPGVLAILLMVLTSVLTSISIVKEKEYGTMEQLIVTPIRPYELMIGKMAPFIVLGLIDVLMVIFIANFWFKVPLNGSIWLLLSLCLVFLLTSLGTGLYVSTVSHNMQQTILSIIFIMLPSILLSGFVFPVSNMPDIIQWFTFIIPMRYFLTIVRGIFLKGIGIEYLWAETLVLLFLGGTIFVLAVKKFKKKLE